MSAPQPLVEARGLTVHFPLKDGTVPWRMRRVVRAVDGVDISISERETVALVGESGCGKSTVGRALLHRVEPTSGRVLFRGHDVTALPPGRLRLMRRHMQMVFQDPYASLNPRMTIGETVAEPLRVHGIASARERRERVAECLATVGIRPDWAKRYPHEFSGGQRQRVAIARAVVLRPDFIVADEPLSALDVSLQIQIIDLFETLKEQLSLTYLFISHDLAVVRQIAQHVIVMYLGQVMESGLPDALFDRPAHPYTRALLDAVPIPDPARERARRFVALGGELPGPASPPSGCRFHTRCPHAMPVCRVEPPPAIEVAPGQMAACHLHAKG